VHKGIVGALNIAHRYIQQGEDTAKIARLTQKNQQTAFVLVKFPSENVQHQKSIGIKNCEPMSVIGRACHCQIVDIGDHVGNGRKVSLRPQIRNPHHSKQHGSEEDMRK
jgi:hypothetical protein